MQYYPVFLNLADRPCLVVGGGKVAERKVKGLLEAGGRLTVISPEITDGLAALHGEERIAWQERPFLQGDLAGFFLVIAATDDVEVQHLVHQEAEQRGILLNVADVPDLCGFILPATVRHGDLAISVSTGGKSPALARKLRLELEKRFGPEYKVLVDLLGFLRPLILAADQSQHKNEVMFNDLLHDDLAEWIRQQDWNAMQLHLLAVLGDLGSPAVLEQAKKLVFAGDNNQD